MYKQFIFNFYDIFTILSFRDIIECLNKKGFDNMKKIVFSVLILLMSMSLFACVSESEAEIDGYDLTIVSDQEIEYSVTPDGPYERGESVTVTLEDYEEGYSFFGWLNEQDQRLTHQYTINVTLNQDMTLQASFEVLEDDSDNDEDDEDGSEDEDDDDVPDDEDNDENGDDEEEKHPLLTKELDKYDNYYESVEELYGDELVEGLRELMQRDVTYQTYGDARDILQISDQDPNDDTKVIQLYTRDSAPREFVCPTHDNCNWNREHVWPMRRLPTSNRNSNLGSDLHNLAPADYDENAYRAYSYFNDQDIQGVSYEPHDDVKGNVSRMMFYMDVMYEELSLVSGTPNADNFEMGDLDFLLQWHIDDPVDDFELNRHEVIIEYQNNRNPFIDYPHFAELIWYEFYGTFE